MGDSESAVIHTRWAITSILALEKALQMVKWNCTNSVAISQGIFVGFFFFAVKACGNFLPFFSSFLPFNKKNVLRLTMAGNRTHWTENGCPLIPEKFLKPLKI